MKKYQRGATMWTTLTVGLMAGFIVYLTFILGDIYLNFRIIRSSMQEIVNQPNFKEMTTRAILSAMEKRMMIDNIRDFKKDTFSVKKLKSGEKYIVIKYDSKAHVASNIYVLVEFNEEIRRAR